MESLCNDISREESFPVMWLVIPEAECQEENLMTQAYNLHGLITSATKATQMTSYIIILTTKLLGQKGEK